MGHIDRLSLVSGLLISDIMCAVFWVYFEPEVTPLIEAHPGPFTSGWEMLRWTVPTLISVIALLCFGYLVYGTITEEKKGRQTPVVRRR